MKTKVVKEGISEAICGARFFLSTQNEFNMAEPVATVDVGGGTTDLSLFSEHRLLFEDSVKFAGGNLLAVTENFKDLTQQDSSDYDQIMRTWPYVRDDMGGQLAAFANKHKGSRVIRNIALFYGSVCYYLGLHLRRQSLDKPLSKVAFAGNGIRFLHIITVGNILTQTTLDNWIGVFRACLKAGHSWKDSYNTSFYFSDVPKLEVAIGLVTNFEIHDPIGPGRATRKMLGLKAWNHSVTIEADQWPEQHAKELTSFQFDLTPLRAFMKVFNDSLTKNYASYKVKIPDSDGERSIIDKIRNGLERRGNQPLVNPLFFEAVESIMEKS
jgi:hypothetical protein